MATKKKAAQRKTAAKRSSARKRITPRKEQRGLEADEVALDLDDAGGSG
jgi:hypothetical protein